MGLSDRERDFIKCQEILTLLIEEIATLPNSTIKQVINIRKAYEEFNSIQIEKLNLGNDNSRQKLQVGLQSIYNQHKFTQIELKKFLQQHSSSVDSGFLFDDIKGLTQLLNLSLTQNLDPQKLKFKISEHSLEKNLIAWKIIFDVIWEKLIIRDAQNIRELIPDLEKGYLEFSKNSDQFSQIPALYKQLGENCSFLVTSYDESQRFLSNKFSEIFNQQKSHFCRNLIHQYKNFEKRPKVIGTIEVNPDWPFKIAAGLDTTKDALTQKLKSQDKFRKGDFEFVIESAKSNWINPLSLKF